jgi:hypothetical protein
MYFQEPERKARPLAFHARRCIRARQIAEEHERGQDVEAVGRIAGAQGLSGDRRRGRDKNYHANKGG